MFVSRRISDGRAGLRALCSLTILNRHPSKAPSVLQPLHWGCDSNRTWETALGEARESLRGEGGALRQRFRLPGPTSGASEEPLEDVPRCIMSVARPAPLCISVDIRPTGRLEGVVRSDFGQASVEGASCVTAAPSGMRREQAMGNGFGGQGISWGEGLVLHCRAVALGQNCGTDLWASWAPLRGKLGVHQMGSNLRGRCWE